MRQIAANQPASSCDYCGAVHHPAFYFCVVCSKPYRTIESLTGSARPPHLSEGERIQLRAPHAVPLFWSYFVAILLGGIVSYFAFYEDRPDLAILMQTGLIFLLTCYFCVGHWRCLAMQLSVVGFDKPVALLAVACLVPTLLVNFLYFEFLREALGLKGGNYLDQLRDAGVSESSLIVFFCVFPAITEEIAFRGLLQHWLQVAINPMRALVLASFLFSALHFSIISLPYLFAVGLLLGWVKMKSGSLYPSMLIHFLHNLVVIEFFHAA